MDAGLVCMERPFQKRSAMLYLPSEFPQQSDLCYLNHAAVGPWPRRTAQTVANFAQQNMLRGATDYPSWLKVETRLRERLARLLEQQGGQACYPRPEFCTDNGAMIAYAGALRLQAGQHEAEDFGGKPRWPMDELAAVRVS